MVKTERKVLYILENPSINSEEHDGAKQQRRWRVYFDNLEYTTADFVVISGKWSYILFICNVPVPAGSGRYRWASSACARMWGVYTMA